MNKIKKYLAILVFSIIFLVLSVFNLNARDSVSYPYVNIGNQVWMTKNLDVVCYRNGDSIPQVQDAEEWEKLTTGAWCYYKNNSDNNEIHGKLYNWYAVTDPRGLEPEGWHVPNWDEWNVLITYIGGEEIAGGKLKAVSELWKKNPYGEGTNESGFTALPSGCRVYDGWFYLDGIKICFWTTSYPVDNKAISVELIFHSKSSSIYYEDKRGGLSVRCVKD